MEDNSNLGGKIKDVLDDALNTESMKGLNKNIENVVNKALSETKKFLNTEKTSATNHTGPIAYPNKFKKFLLMLLGVGAIIIFGPMFILFLSYGLIKDFGMMTLAIGITSGAFIALGLYLINMGLKMWKAEKRANGYLSRVSGKGYCTIEDISDVGLYDEKYIINDLKSMIKTGIFPEGHMSKEDTYFLLNNKVYSDYKELEKEINLKENKAKANENLSPEARKIVDDGRNFIKTIKEANIDIPGEEVSIKLDRLEDISNKIYDHVESHPDKIVETKKFSEYFLPTTLKLVETYRRLDSQTIEGENILTAKKEIEDSLDTINNAFENLLDSLFEDISMDISTDISVLETMLMQEGLTSNDSMKINSK